MQTPWGEFAVSDAHVHFFSRSFFAALAAQCGKTAEQVADAAGWDAARRRSGGTGARLGGGAGRARRRARGADRQRAGRRSLGRGRGRGLPRSLLRLLHGESAGRGSAGARADRAALRAARDLPLPGDASLFDARSARRGDHLRPRQAIAGRAVFVHCGVLTVGHPQEARAALALRHALFQSARPARRGAALSEAEIHRCRTSARAFCAKR